MGVEEKKGELLQNYGVQVKTKFSHQIVHLYSSPVLCRDWQRRAGGRWSSPRPAFNVTPQAMVWDTALLQFNRGFHETQLARLLINQLCKTDEHSDIMFYTDTAQC